MRPEMEELVNLGGLGGILCEDGRNANTTCYRPLLVSGILFELGLDLSPHSLPFLGLSPSLM